MHASTPGFVRVAASILPSRAARSASLATSSVGKPNARSMPRARLPESVAGAMCLPSTASNGTPRAPCTNPGARTARTPPAAGATPNGGRMASVQIAINPRREAPVASPARSVRISARITFVGCRSNPRATPSSNAPRRRPRTYDSVAEVSMCLAFAKLSRDEVDVIPAEPVLASIAAGNDSSTGPGGHRLDTRGRPVSSQASTRCFGLLRRAARRRAVVAGCGRANPGGPRSGSPTLPPRRSPPCRHQYHRESPPRVRRPDPPPVRQYLPRLVLRRWRINRGHRHRHRQSPR